jgi:hypothetical protein
MSSAILYLAIVAIWAGVLIPRWLRRDTLRGAVTAHEAPLVPEADVVSDADADAAEVTDDNDDTTVAERDERDPAPLALTAAESRHRMLKARRRLLGMLLVLEAAAVGLAVLGLAAMWVVVPPSLMLAGYTLLLREAAKADREHDAREAELAARTAAAQSRQRARAERRTAAAAAATAAEAAAAAAAAARFAAAPVAADYEGGGRDFAPGLAGKYTTSHDDYEYPERHLRAVGD